MWKKLVVSLFVVTFSIPALAAAPTAPQRKVLRPTAGEWCPEGVAPSRDADCVTLPVLVSAVPAAYPELALKGRISGQVDLEIVVEENGRVEEVRVVRPNRVFTDAAVAAVKQRRYKPATRGGVPVATAFPVMVKFDLVAPTGNPLAAQRTGVGGFVTVTPYDTKFEAEHRARPTTPHDTRGAKK